MRLAHRLLNLAPVVVIAGVFARFAGDGFKAYFTPDDMMNLYGAWFHPLLGEDRPLGALVYRALFALFELRPAPYRIVAMLLLLVNLWLLYRVGRRLSGSKEVAAVACLLGAYHAHLADLYYSTGTIYDLLCFTFFYIVLDWYAAIRERGRVPSVGQGIGLLVLYLCALTSKEMAASLPVLLLIYEILWHRPRVRDAVRSLWVVWATGALTALYMVHKVMGANAMTNNPSYALHLSWTAALDAWHHYTGELFYNAVDWTPGLIIVLWQVLILIAGVMRRREVTFALAIMTVGMLPVTFIAPRGFFSIYLTLPGWYLFAAAALVAVREHWLAGRPGLVWRQAAMFALLTVFLARCHAANRDAAGKWLADAHASVKTVEVYLRDHPEPLPEGARILFITDPFPKDEWLLTFIFRLHYLDDSIRVERAKWMTTPPENAKYARIFSLTKWRMVRQ